MCFGDFFICHIAQDGVKNSRWFWNRDRERSGHSEEEKRGKVIRSGYLRIHIRCCKKNDIADSF